MKKLSFLFLILAIGISSCKSDKKSSDTLDTDLIENPATLTDPDSKDLAVITFEQTEHNFENIFENEVVEHSFKFKNTGKNALLISDAKASCGCTVPEWPKKPIQPNEEGEIIVKFDSKGRQGTVNKTVTVLANTNPNTTVLKIRGYVVAGPKE